MAMAGDGLHSRTWRRIRLAVLDRDGWRCQIAGPECSSVATCVDHIVPRSEGGAMWDPANLRAACRRCNGRRSALALNERRRRRTTPYLSRF
jgi:5-methylcytosine-specific restriction endonuclease McrA